MWRRHTVSRTTWRTNNVRMSPVTCDMCMWHVTPNSPEVNPVDYAVWGALQQMVYCRRQYALTVEQLYRRATITERSKLSQCFTDHAINEWRHRLECVVQQQGGHTQHCFWMNLYSFVCLTLFIYSSADITNTFYGSVFGPAWGQMCFRFQS